VGGSHAHLQEVRGPDTHRQRDLLCGRATERPGGGSVAPPGGVPTSRSRLDGSVTHSRAQRARVRAARAWLDGRPHEAWAILDRAGLVDEFPRLVREGLSLARQDYQRRMEAVTLSRGGRTPVPWSPHPVRVYSGGTGRQRARIAEGPSPVQPDTGVPGHTRPKGPKGQIGHKPQAPQGAHTQAQAPNRTLRNYVTK